MKKKPETKRFLKYLTSSFVSTVVEEGLFLLLTYLLCESLTGFLLALLPMAVARVVSAYVNFEINWKWVFPVGGSKKRALFRFYLQLIPVSVAQVLLTYGAYSLFHIGEEQVLLRGGIYACVMTALFVVNFLGQKLWVFSASKEKV